MHAFDHAYWPPHVATAWIITRDRNFVDRLRLDQSMRSVSIAYAIASNGCKPAGSPTRGATTLGSNCRMQ